MLELQVTRGEKTYKASFSKPNISTYSAFFDYLVTEPFMADITLARNCFDSGDEEMIDFDNNIDLFYEYKTDLVKLLELKPAGKVKKVPTKYKDLDYTLAITLRDNNTSYYAFFSKPDFITTRKVMALYDNNQPFEASKLLATSTFLDGNSEMIDYKEHPEYFASYKQYMLDAVSAKVGEVKKKILAVPDIDIREGYDELEKMSALIAYELGINPYTITDEDEWIELWKAAKYIRQTQKINV